MTVEPKGRDVKAARAAVIERMARKLDRYLPESGELRKWTISEIETALIEDMNELARDMVHARLGVDPDRVVDKPRAPTAAGRSWASTASAPPTCTRGSAP